MLYLDKIVICNTTFYAYELPYVDLSLFEYFGNLYMQLKKYLFFFCICTENNNYFLHKS